MTDVMDQGQEQEINKPGCLRADPVSKATATDLSTERKRERDEDICKENEIMWESHMKSS